VEESTQTLKEDEGSGGTQLRAVEEEGNEVGYFYCEFEDKGGYSGQANRWVMKRARKQDDICSWP
jgi:hypothetical protein